ncbi:restriction endonuclease subunit S [Piscinibacter sakaiensis]|uniref:Type I restriction-modification system, specificity subunit S n=1 Tax=Piscinibacter sakaiensis TaxID=1547922 RepID=A0A0K8P5E2_PISS1|nr:restriction endonuclease subunit S [Piscinibacter sakaiensis]GAP37832.1 type I restriction-modification system, specificity subunit S [Piscinibacter sakaiensis]
MKTGATKDKATKALVPKLRFPEFRGAEGWNERPLAELMSESRLPGSKGNVAKKITVKLWGNGVFEKNDSIQGSINTQYFRRKAGQFIYSKLDFLNQAFGIIPPSLDNFESTVDLPCFDFADELNPVFLLEYVKRRDFYERLGETADGSRKARRIHAETFLSFPIALPIRAEQQKIANCLSSLDELIAAQGRKVEALKTHKKGLMQQLFPREEESQPRLRFPEFQDAGNWKKMTLGTAANFYNGRAYKQEELLDAGKYKVLRVGNFFTNNNWYYSNLELDETKYCEDGDLLYAWSASFGPRVWSGEKTIYHYHIWKVVEQSGIDKKFLFIVLEHETERMKAKTTNGLGIMHITKGAIESWESLFPDLAEQRKIADRLMNLEGAAKAEAQKLKLLTVHKEALMQQLFPSIDEIKL